MMSAASRSLTVWPSTSVPPKRSLSDDTVSDPAYGLEEQSYIEQVRDLYGNKGAAEMKFLLERNAALFAGGELPQEAKDAFFEAVMKAYITCKEESKKTFGRKHHENG